MEKGRGERVAFILSITLLADTHLRVSQRAASERDSCVLA